MMADDNLMAELDAIRADVIGDGAAIPGPFGPRPLIYADYVASGRALGRIEDAIRRAVLPFYGNTHTETSYTGRNTTRLREAARAAIRKAVGADDDHAVIFTGSGATAAADKLLRAIARLPGARPPERPVVFVGPYEHHSNDLPWRESGAQLVRIPLDSRGSICMASLTRALEAHADAAVKVGAFAAASNVTGVKSDLASLARLLHQYGAHFVCDFAAAGPYIEVKMGESTRGAGDRIDAAFFSPHKFIGGAGASGVLVADKALLPLAPTVAGGGTVSYVTHDRHAFVADPERREEAGTPGIVENIRAGMVFELKSRIGAAAIEACETALMTRLEAAWGDVPGIERLGPCDVPRLAIYAFNVRHGERLLHHNFVVALLNDLFGIQARGGCSCAGPYGHDLLGIDDARSRQHEKLVARGLAVFRPGWARLGLNYFFSDETVDYIAAAVGFIARRGIEFLPLYRLDAAAGTWRVPATSDAPAQPRSLEALLDQVAVPCSAGFSQCLDEAEQIADSIDGSAEVVRFDDDAEALRWFWMPHEVGGAREPSRRAINVRMAAD
jgi:selenocysteine lyase/cysteine desulfurase